MLFSPLLWHQFEFISSSYYAQLPSLDNVNPFVVFCFCHSLHKRQFIQCAINQGGLKVVVQSSVTK